MRKITLQETYNFWALLFFRISGPPLTSPDLTIPNPTIKRSNNHYHIWLIWNTETETLILVVVYNMKDDAAVIGQNISLIFCDLYRFSISMWYWKVCDKGRYGLRFDLSNGWQICKYLKTSPNSFHWNYPCSLHVWIKVNLPNAMRTWQKQ